MAAVKQFAINRIELRHLRYFIATAEELNFGRAAEKLSLVGNTIYQRTGA